jgi:hypothetical protein
MPTDAFADDQLLTETEVRRVLARAAEIDKGRSSLVSPAQLASIGQEVGISEAALNQALLELRGTAPAQPQAAAVQQAKTSPKGKTLRKWLRRLKMVAAGAVLGALAVALEEVGAIAGFTLLGGITISLMLHHRHKRTPTDYQAELGALWAAFLTGLAAAAEGITREPAILITIFWIVAAVVGAVVTTLDLRLLNREEPPEQKPVRS